MLKTEQRIIQVYPLWQRGQLLLGCAAITIDCDNNLMGTLRRAWLVPRDCAGGKDYDLLFFQPDPNIQNVLTGIWMQTSDGEGIVLNASSITDIISACDSCCGNSPVVAVEYSPTAPIVPVVEYLPSLYFFTRTDNGSNYAKVKAEMDYYGQYLPGTFTLLSHSGTTTNYSFSSMHMPSLLNVDAYTGVGPYYKKVSNEAPPKATNDQYSLMVYSSYYGNSGPWVGKTLAEIVYQLQTVGGFTTDVAVSVDQNRIMALTVQNDLTFELGVEAITGTVFVSNDSPAIPAGQHLTATITLNGVLQYPTLSAANVNALSALLSSTAPYSSAGGWSAINSDQIQLNTTVYTSATITLTASNVFTSNPGPALTAGQTYQLTVYVNGNPLTPVPTAPTLAEIAANIPTTMPGWTTIGGVWSVNADQIVLTGSTLPEIYLILTAVAEPVILSDDRPASGRYATTIILDSTQYFPMVTASGVTSGLDLAAIPEMAALGTWSYPDPKVQLTVSQFSEGMIVLSGNGVILSNPAPTLPAGHIYQLRIFLTNAFSPVDVVGATLAELITNIPTDYPPYASGLPGTWSVQTNQVRMENPFVAIAHMYVMLQTMTSPVFVSNAIGAIGSQHANVRVEIGTTPIYPIMSAASTGDLVTRLNAYAPFSTMGTWATSGSNAIQLTTTKYNPINLVLAVSNVFYSNPAPTLTAGQVFRLRGYWDTAFIIPDVVGTTLASVASKIAGSGAWAAFGGAWSVGGTGNDQIINTGSTNKTLYLYLDAVTAPVFLSNVAPAVPTNQHLSQTVTVGTEIAYPILSAGDLAFLRTRTAGIAPYSSMGTWAVSGGNKMQLSGAGYDPITLVLTATDIFYSNPVVAATAAQQYRLKTYLNTAFMTPDVVGNTFDIIIGQMPSIPVYAALGGTWSKTANDIRLTGSTETGIYLVLSIETRPPLAVDSNVAPVLPGGDQYVLTATVDLVVLSPTITGLTVAELATNAQANATYAAHGTWTLNTDKVHLASTTVSVASLVITTETIPEPLMARSTNDNKTAKESTGNRTAASKKVESTAANKRKK